MTVFQSGTIVTDNVNCLYANLSTASAYTIKSTPTQLYGVTINSHSSGSMKIFDGTTAAGTVVCGSLTFAAAERYIPLGGITTGTACCVVLAGTNNITLHYR